MLPSSTKQNKGKEIFRSQVDLPYVGTSPQRVGKISTMYWRQLAMQLQGQVDLKFIQGLEETVEIRISKVNGNKAKVTVPVTANGVTIVQMLLKQLSEN
jgi:hypothetical protein